MALTVGEGRTACAPQCYGGWKVRAPWVRAAPGDAQSRV